MRAITTMLWVLFPILLFGQTNISVAGVTTNSSCNPLSGILDGAIDITASGGSGNYTYQWTGPGVFSTDEDQRGLGAGTYCVIVIDSEGNSSEEHCFVLDEPPAVEVVGVTSEPECNFASGAPNGAIDITATGGTGSIPYYYNWSGQGTVADDEDQTGLGAGTYNVTITDSNGCTATASYTLTEPTAVEISESIDVNPCTGDGISIDITASGGYGTVQGDYTYYWKASTGGVNLNRFDADQSGLNAGIYSVTVTDSEGCIGIAEYDLSNAGDTKLEITTSLTTDNCDLGGEELSLAVNTGKTPFMVSWTSPSGGTLNQNNVTIDELGESIVFRDFDAFSEYNFVVTDANGCQATYDYTSGIDPIREIASPSLCLITSDPESGNNRILWEAPENLDYISQYNVYREGNASGLFNFIGSVDASAENSFVDDTVDPTLQSYSYRVTASDKCDIESEPSNVHKTIHLVANIGLNDRINLEWGDYSGVSYDQVNIYRGESLDNMTLLISLPSSVRSFTDPSPPAGIAYYQVEISGEVECNISRGAFAIRSNIADNQRTSSLSEELSFEVKVLPNPVLDELTINSEKDAKATLYSVAGMKLIVQQIKSGVNTVDVSSLEAGYYFFHLTRGSERSVSRIIIQ